MLPEEICVRGVFPFTMTAPAMRNQIPVGVRSSRSKGLHVARINWIEVLPGPLPTNAALQCFRFLPELNVDLIAALRKHARPPYSEPLHRLAMKRRRASRE